MFALLRELFPGNPFDGQAQSDLMRMLRKPVSKSGMGLHQPHRPADTSRQTAAKHPAMYKASNRILEEVWAAGGREAMDAHLAEWNQGEGGGYLTRQFFKPLRNLNGEEDPNKPPYFEIEYSARTQGRRAKRLEDQDQKNAP